MTLKFRSYFFRTSRFLLFNKREILHVQNLLHKTNMKRTFCCLIEESRPWTTLVASSPRSTSLVFNHNLGDKRNHMYGIKFLNIKHAKHSIKQHNIFQTIESLRNFDRKHDHQHDHDDFDSLLFSHRWNENKAPTNDILINTPFAH